MYTDDVQICGTLRNYKSDIDYLSFGDFWIQKLSAEDKLQLSKDLKHFTNHPYDNYIVVKWHYIGRGKSYSVLRDNEIMFFYPLYMTLKLFKSGDLIMPMGFYSWNKKWREKQFQGENYGSGYALKGNIYFFKENEVDVLNKFRKEIEKHFKYINFHITPYNRNPKILSDIDTRCNFAIHLFLKESVENNNPYIIYDRLIAYTIGLESLYLQRRDEEIREHLSLRIAVLLGKNKSEEEQICHLIKQFYDIRSDIVHASLIKEKDQKYLSDNIYFYEDIFRKSILAFLELNINNPTKEKVLALLDEMISNADLKKEIKGSLNLLKLAM